MAETISKTVGSGEMVARIIFSPSYIYKGRVAPTAFRWEVLPSGDVEDYISVLRDDGNDLDAQTRTFRARIQGDRRYGYSLLLVEDVRGIGDRTGLDNMVLTDVLPFPSKKLSNHAGIVAEIDGKRVTALTPVSPEIMLIQKELALCCGDIVEF